MTSNSYTQKFISQILVLIAFFVFTKTLSAQEEKEMAALAPMASLGEFSEMETQIIFNSLQESLSINYALASQKAYEAALEEAFNELEYEECTEDQCFALIQQILQVDNLFLFNMTREGTFTQLTLTRVNLDSQRLVRTAYCENCGIGALNSKVAGLVQKIISEDRKENVESIAGQKIESPPKKTNINPKPAKTTKKEQPVPKKKVIQEPVTDSSSNKIWHISAISMTVLSALMAYNEAKSYNDLSDKNKALATSYNNSSDSTEKAAYKSEYDSNASKMKTHTSTAQTWDLMTLLGLGWEGYLLMSDDSASTAANTRKLSFPFIPRLALQATPSGTQPFLRWTWSF